MPVLSKTAIDGTKIEDALMMRRRVNGRWQYRQLTEEEKAEDYATSVR